MAKTTKLTITDQIKGQEDNKKLLDVAVEDNLPVLLVGETGTGKTSLVREIAAEREKPYTRFSITGETTVDDFVGKYILKDGETVWQDGILLTAVKKGHYLVVDEINAALPEILFVLHSLLDDDRYVIIPQKDNSTVRPHEDFRFFATMNPVDEYAGTKELNKAFHSRFAMVLDVKYPSRQVEVDVLQARTGVDRDNAMKMVDVAIGIRRAKQEGKLFYTLSTRDLLYWGKLSQRIGLHPSFEVAIKNKGSEDGKTIEAIYAKVFSDYERAAEMKLETSIEFYEKEYKRIEELKKNVRPEVEAEVKASLDKERKALGAEKVKIDKEKSILREMENRIKEQIAQNLKK